VSPRIDLVLDTDRLVFRPGEWVRGHVAIIEGGKSRDLNVTVRYRERSPDYSATVAEHTSGSLHTGELTAGQSYDFAAQIPADALPTLSSAHGELYWEVEARSDEFGIDTKASRVIDVTVERAAQAATS
jgi:hypothetical protein